MILGNARDFTEAYAETSVKDVVITVPVYFTQSERLAVEKATQIARLNLLQVRPCCFFGKLDKQA